MNAEVWKKVEELVRAAHGLPPERRAEFLARACPDDPQIRDEVKSLLDAAPAAESFLESSPMSSAISRAMVGRTISHYEILEKLGAGGMGVVYKARDTRLNRFVAIKVLPPEKVSDAERRRRFTQEAKAASALNHPNIITIHDIEESGDLHFISMEYISGKTLASLIPRHGMRLSESLKYAIQIADALAKAHAAGIIHRDLKPGNIMLTEQGLIKVLDFGLAKLTETAAVGEHEATRSIQPATEEGMIVGTVAYMSPEQAEGKKIDARSDIFSFGSVFYEMLTGRRAFEGDTKASTMAAILKDDPQPVSQVVERLPREVERIVRRCLRKDPDQRFQTMADLKVALAELKEESDSGVLDAAARPTGKTRGRLLWLAGSIVFLASIVAGVYVIRLRPGAAVPPLIPVPLTTYRGYQESPTFSPDGNQVAFVWNGQRQDNTDIYVKLIGVENEPLRLTKDPADDYGPGWSPDGHWIAFLRRISGDANGRHLTAVFLVPSIGGVERKLAEAYSDDWEQTHLSWDPGSKWLAITDEDATGHQAIFLLSVETGEKHRLTNAPAKMVDRAPAISPDGRAVAFLRGVNGDSGDLYLLELSEDLSPLGEPKPLTSVNRFIDNPVWTPDGRSILFEWGSLHTPYLARIRIPGLRGRLDMPERLLFAGDSVMQPAVSRQGRLAFLRRIRDTDIWRLELAQGRDGPVAVKAATKLIASTRMDLTPQYSPDGKRLAFASDRTGSYEIWVCDSDGSNAVQLTSFGGPYTADPLWSPDGRWVGFISGYSGHYVIPSGGGRPRRLPDIVDAARLGWSRDGKWIYFRSQSLEQPVWKVPVAGGQPVRVANIAGQLELTSAAFYFLRNGGLWKLEASGQETQVLPSVINDDFAVVGRGVYFIPKAEKSFIQFLNFATSKITTIAPASPGWAYGFAVSPDERWILYAQPEPTTTNLMLVENFR